MRWIALLSVCLSLAIAPTSSVVPVVRAAAVQVSTNETHTYNAWPELVRYTNSVRTNLLCVWANGGSHVSSAFTNLARWDNGNNGASWGGSFRVPSYNGVTVGISNQIIFQSSTNSEPSFYTTFDGTNFSPRTVVSGFWTFPIGAGYRGKPAQLRNGDYVFCFFNWTNVFVARGGGATWSTHIVTNSPLADFDWNESSVIEDPTTNGTVYLAVRRASDKGVWLFASTNSGTNWSYSRPIYTNIVQALSAPSEIQFASDGSLIATIDTDREAGIWYFFRSTDLGYTWRSATTIHSGGTWYGGGHPSFIQRGSSQVFDVVYYLDPSISVGDIWFDSITIPDMGNPQRVPIWRQPAILNLTTPVAGENITNRLADFSYAGVQGGIPTNYTVYTNMPLVSGANATFALKTALSNAPAGTKIMYPAGVFLHDEEFILTTGVVIGGAGMNRTTNLTFSVSSSRDNTLSTIDSEQIVSGGAAGLTQGSDTIYLTNTSSFTVGKMALLAQAVTTTDTEYPMQVATGGTNGVGMYLRDIVLTVVAKSPFAITISPPLPDDMSARHCRIKAMNQTSYGKGLVDMTILPTTAQNGVIFSGHNNSFLSGVRIMRPLNYGVQFSSCMFMEIRDCWIDDVNAAQLSNGAGILFNDVCSSLVVNNVITHCGPGIEMNSGSSANVFAYNFLLNTNVGAASPPEVFSNHGPQNSKNIWEGNIYGRHISDGYFGGEQFGVAHGNLIHGKQIMGGSLNVPYTLGFKRFTHGFTLLRNILGSPSPFVTFTYSFEQGPLISTNFGQPNIGNSTASGVGPPFVVAGSYNAGIGNGCCQELDTNVLRTTMFVMNADFGTNGSAPYPLVQNLHQNTNIAIASLIFSNAPYSMAGVTEAFPPFAFKSTNQTLSSLNFSNSAVVYSRSHYLWLFGELPRAPGVMSVLSGSLKISGSAK